MISVDEAEVCGSEMTVEVRTFLKGKGTQHKNAGDKQPSTWSQRGQRSKAAHLSTAAE